MEPEKKIIGFIGLGVMGKSMASHILNAGYELHVFSRTKRSAKNLMARGAVWENTVADLSRKCDVILGIVGFPSDVKDVYLSENGVICHARPGTIVIDMTTSSPDLAVTIYQKGRKAGIDCLDAPVSGGDLGAQNATLSIMVGGEKKYL